MTKAIRLAVALGFVSIAATNVLAAPTAIDSVSTTGSTLNSITVGTTTYTDLTAPTGFVDNNAGTDWLHISPASAPADIAAAAGSFDLGLGALNIAFEAQFGGALTDTSVIYLIINENDTSANDTSANDTANLYAIDAAGNRLSSAFAMTDFFSVTTPALSVDTYNRTTGGSANGTLERTLVGVTFTLTDLGFNGLGATGIEFEHAGSSDRLDLHEVGIAVIPEPGSLALLGLGALCLIGRRRSSP